jgi:hypothetical protein
VKTSRSGRQAEQERVRRRVLAEWRRLPVERDTSAHLRTTAELVPTVLRGLGVEKRLNEERLGAAWSGLVGPFIAQHSHPLRLDRTTLVVAVSQPVVLHTLERDLKRDVLAKLKAAFGETTISAVRFVPG